MLKNQAEIPKCFGELYDASAKECTGGFDSAYKAENGSHIRPRCDFVTPCSAKSEKQQQQIIPTSHLLRAQQPQHQTQFSTSGGAASPYQRPTLPTAPPTRTYGGYQQPTQQPPPYPHQVGVQQMVPVNFGIPQYLTTREPHTSGSFPKRLGLELVRSMGKSLGHTLANFFDTEILGHKPNQGEPRNQ